MGSMGHGQHGSWAAWGRQCPPAGARPWAGASETGQAPSPSESTWLPRSDDSESGQQIARAACIVSSSPSTCEAGARSSHLLMRKARLREGERPAQGRTVNKCRDLSPGPADSCTVLQMRYQGVCVRVCVWWEGTHFPWVTSPRLESWFLNPVLFPTLRQEANLILTPFLRGSFSWECPPFHLFGGQAPALLCSHWQYRGFGRPSLHALGRLSALPRLHSPGTLR